jgi:nucleoside-diphosphate-sugar epimerase
VPSTIPDQTPDAALARLGVIGASGFVGEEIVRIAREFDLDATAISRNQQASTQGTKWSSLNSIDKPIPLWVDTAPITTFPERSAAIANAGARKVVIVSSTSLLTKCHSSSTADRRLAESLARSEQFVQDWAVDGGIDWVILRPTLIYGFGKDRNVREIARMIERFGVFPKFGAAEGKRQPIHAADVARACVSALMAPCTGRSYNISGSEVLTYREMVERIFLSMGRRPIVPTVPLPVFRAALFLINRIPRYSSWTPSMAERMNQDMVFDHSDAVRDFGFSPRPFVLSRSDVTAS